MKPVPLDAHTKARMERQLRSDTAPELRLRRELHRRGLRYRVDRSPVPGMRSRADVVFGPEKVAVFVDGCFWHACPEHGSIPKNNRNWWQEKLAANQARDRRVDAELLDRGWNPIRIWEHEDVSSAADKIERVVRRRSGEGDCS